MVPVQVLHIDLPEYQLNRVLDYDDIGQKIDRLLEENLSDGFYLERSIGMVDHPGMTLEELTAIILTTGWDKYDPTRTSIFDEEFACFTFDIHASEFHIENNRLAVQPDHSLKTYFGQNIYCFHQLAKIDRGYPVRIGISMIYDKSKLLPAIQTGECDEHVKKYSQFLFRFGSSDPVEALRAIIKLG